jgi:integrase
MSIITVCKTCKKRTSGGMDRCPHCQGADLRFIVDYRPNGRYGHRIRQALPENINTAYAAREIEALMHESRRKKFKPASPQGSTVDELFPQYLEWYELYRAKTTHTDLNSIWESHFKQHLGPKRVEDIESSTIQFYQKMRRAEGVCNRTINKELDYFSGFRKWCARECNIPAPAVRPQRLPHKRPLPQILGIEEVIKILDASDPFHRAYFLAMFSLGLRIDEARQLRWQDIDFKNRILRVKQKGGSFKILPASDWFTGALKEIRPDEPTQKELKAGAKPVAEQFVFLNKKTGKPVFQVRKALARACEKAGIERHVYPHLFRHSVATFLMGKNINMRVIQGYMGHSKIGTTEFYTHVAVENLREAENAIMSAYKKVLSAKVNRK